MTITCFICDTFCTTREWFRCIICDETVCHDSCGKEVCGYSVCKSCYVHRELYGVEEQLALNVYYDKRNEIVQRWINEANVYKCSNIKLHL